jgi:hypothetical protein
MALMGEKINSGFPNPAGWQMVARGRFGLLAKRPLVTGPSSACTPAGVPEPQNCKWIAMRIR